MDPASAYQLIHDELTLDGNPTLNLATFVTTWMDDEADKLMAETANKNAIDWDEYPQTVELQDRCVNMLARLFGAPEGRADDRLRNRRVLRGDPSGRAGHEVALEGGAPGRRDGPTTEPNLVMGANVQVCWEKFARYFDVEPRYVPLTKDRFIIGVDEAMALVDENTIGVVGILGSTYTGEYEPIAALAAALDQRHARDGVDVPIHVDAASGGFVAPFVQPELEWDFRLPRVKSINVSGHKYGLVYPGVGWVVWREIDDLPKDLIFEVDYLGGSHANFSLNFSRGASQIVAQYYNFLRLGRTGYRQVMEALSSTARWIAGELGQRDGVRVIAEGADLPVVCFSLTGSPPRSVFDLSELLRRRGWIVPAYKMAPDAEDVEVLRIVVREGLSRDLAAELVHDIGAALDQLAAGPPVVQPHGPAATPAPGHRRGATRLARPRPARKTRAVC